MTGSIQILRPGVQDAFTNRGVLSRDPLALLRLLQTNNEAGFVDVVDRQVEDVSLVELDVVVSRMGLGSLLLQGFTSVHDRHLHEKF